MNRPDTSLLRSFLLRLIFWYEFTIGEELVYGYVLCRFKRNSHKSVLKFRSTVKYQDVIVSDIFTKQNQTGLAFQLISRNYRCHICSKTVFRIFYFITSAFFFRHDKI